MRRRRGWKKKQCPEVTSDLAPGTSLITHQWHLRAMSGEGRGGTGRKQVVRGRRPQARPSVWREDLQTPTREPNDGDSLGRGPGGKGSWGRLLDAVRRQDATRGRWRTGGSGSKHGLEPAPCSGGERSQPDWKAGGWRGPTIISLANSSLLHHLGDPDLLGDVMRGTSVHAVLSTTSGLPRAPEGHLRPQNLLEPSTVAPLRRARTPHHPPESDATPTLALFSAHDTSVSQSPVGSRPFWS